ncbi:MAG: hypothetical protein IJI52_07420 [Solobacterium sp.]|nr:hypothetical protein [Solobacterium sp.]
MARRVKEKDGRSYEERVKTGRQFYFFLLKLFLSAAVVLGAGLGYLWYWLERYEAESINGAMTTYFERVGNQDWDGLYQDDVDYFVEFNSKEDVAEYLFSTYNGKNSWGLTTSFSWTDGKNEFYNVYYEREQICIIELTKPAGSKTWKVRTLSPSGEYYFDDYTGNGFTINNVDITNNAAYYKELTIPYGFRNLELDEKMPKAAEYLVRGFIHTPDIELKQPQTDMYVRDHTTNLYYIGKKPTEEQLAEFTEEIETVSVDYCKYITRDGTFYSLNRHLYPYTEFYNNIRGFDNQWFASHESIEFRNMKVFDVMPVGENAFIGSISFDYIVSTTSVNRTYSNTYQLFFVKNSQNDWKLTNLVIVYDDSMQE